MTQSVRLFSEQGILHQPLKLGLGQSQHQIFHRRQCLEQVGIEGPRAGGQLLGERIAGILTAL